MQCQWRAGRDAAKPGGRHTFAELGVASINVSGTAGNVNLGGGNTQTFRGSFTRVGGAIGNAGTAELAGSLLLANNNFYRQFTDDPAITAGAQALPQMQGSGLVRDLRPAMSLGTAQALDLQCKLTRITIDLIAGYVRQSVATGRFDCEKRCLAVHQSPLTRRSVRSRTKSAHASCARLTGHKGLGKRMSAEWAVGCGSLTTRGTVTQLGLDELTLQGLHIKFGVASNNLE